MTAKVFRRPRPHGEHESACVCPPAILFGSRWINGTGVRLPFGLWPEALLHRNPKIIDLTPGVCN